MLVRAILLYLMFYLVYRAYKWYRQMRQRLETQPEKGNNAKSHRVHIDKEKIEDAEFHEIKDDE